MPARIHTAESCRKMQGCYLPGAVGRWTYSERVHRFITVFLTEIVQPPLALVQGSSNKHHISKNTVPGTGRTRENMRQGNRKVAEPSPLTEGPKKGPCSSGGEVSG